MTSALTAFEARILVAGSASGPVVAIPPLSLWGGYDPETGRIIDRTHPAYGAGLAGKILAMRTGRGSSSSSSVLAEAIRLGTGPAAIVLAEPDSILCVGAMVAETLYGRTCPIVVVDGEEHSTIRGAAWAELESIGDTRAVVRVSAPPPK